MTKTLSPSKRPTRLSDWLRYWRASLADQDRSAPKASNGVAVERESLRRGALSKRELKELRTLTRKTKKQEALPDSRKDQEPASWDVLLCPLVLRSTLLRGHAKQTRSRLVHPLWIPAVLYAEGNLAPHPRALPWIPRRHLEPAVWPQVTVGTVEVLDRFLTRESRPRSWDGAWDLCRRLLQEVAGQDLDRFEIEDHEVTNRAYCLPWDQAGLDFSVHVRGLYERLEERWEGRDPETETGPALLTSICNSERQPARELLTEEEQRAAAHRHLGQMTGQFGLAPSQREAFHHFLLQEDGEILGLQGPPGTGKTTLLQSVVATLWVQAALEGAEPPVILAASTNNQAILNILDAFARVGPDEKPKSRLEGRWLPEVESYGLFCASPGQATDDRPHVLPRGDGLFDRLEDGDYQVHAVSRFMEAGQLAFGRPFRGLQELTDHLHEELRNTVEEVRRTLQDSYVLSETVADVVARHGIDSVAQGIESRDPDAEPELGTVREALEAAETELQEQLIQQEVEVARAADLVGRWNRHVDTEPFWMTLFGFLPEVRKRSASRNWAFFFDQDLEAPDNTSDKEALREHLVAGLLQTERRERELRDKLARVKSDRTRLAEAEETWERWQREHPETPDGADPERLDRGPRYQAFLLATHYWEGRWLLEREAELRASHDPASAWKHVGRKALEVRWRRHAKIAPCLVSTLFMAPTFFSAGRRNEEPLYDFLDLLILDEAGQVSAEVAGATFALARQALVVGDIHQLEPVRKLPEAVDRANLQAFGLAQTDEEILQLQSSGRTASRGSAMELALGCSRWEHTPGERGLLLREHRRSVPEILAYCNELVYRGRLEACRESLEDAPLPALGWAHVPGRAERQGGSWRNPGEAATLAEWLSRNARRLKKHYDTSSLEDVVGIITPFAAQARCLERELRREMLQKVEVGTVHRFQGAERPVVLFSPTYDRQAAGEQIFFDDAPNLLNVAVSRARDSFVVFGEMELFDPDKPGRPLGLLARHLFQSPEQEILDIQPLMRPDRSTVVAVDRLESLERHRNALRHCLDAARESVMIVSPWISPNALEADRIPERIQAALERNVEVKVFTHRGWAKKWSAPEALEILTDTGAEIHAVPRIHNKTLAMDREILVEGSFNWLSASRDKRYNNAERSLAYRGPKVAEWTAETLAMLEAKIPLVER